MTVTGQPFSQTLQWPADLVSAAALGTVDPAYNSGSVTVTLPADTPAGVTAVAPTSAGASASGPLLQCGGGGGAGGAVTQLGDVAVSPTSHTFSFPMGDLIDQGGSCRVSFSLSDGANPDPYGGPSPTIPVGFTIGTPPSYSFSAKFVGCKAFQCGILGNPYQIDVDMQSSFAGGGAWSVSAQNSVPGCSVSQSLGTPPSFPVTLQVPQLCPSVDQMTVTVAWTYLGQVQSWQASPQNNPGAPATTVAPTTTTPTTSAPTTTLPPCVASKASTTTDCTTTTTSKSSGTAAGASGNGLAAARGLGTDLAAARQVGTTPSPAGVAGWALAGLALPLLVGTGRRVRDRRHSKKGSP